VISSILNRLMLKRLGVVPTHAVTTTRDLKVKMADGVELLTDVYFGDRGKAAPVIMIRSPYGKRASFAAGSAYPLATQGFNVVLQSCRGTFGSRGTFDPFHDEQRDGLATIEWIKQQPWCNGSIGTYGMSYLGFTQWAVSATAGPEVKAMAMQVTLSDFALMTYAGDSFYLETVLGWTNVVNKMKGSPLVLLRFALGQLLGLRSIPKHGWKTLPLTKLDESVVGHPVQFWQDWLEHDSPTDSWWTPMNHRRTIPEVKRPITHVAGWFDIFVSWQLQDFAALRKAGCEAQITVGPWAHIDLGVSATGMQEAIVWFNRHLRGKPSTSSRKPLKLYVIGADDWREFDEWPPRECVVERWHLQPRFALHTHIAPASEPDRYRYDPADPTPSVGGPSVEGRRFSVDNAVLEKRSDVLTYTSEPLSQARDLIGEIAAELHVRSTGPSADFFVRICDVDERGVSRNICDGLQRVQMDPDGPVQCVRVALSPIAYRIEQGHRIRVQISSGAFPRWARNLGGTEHMGQATELRVVTQSIFHAPNHPSAVMLPFQVSPSGGADGRAHTAMDSASAVPLRS
jgi:uncharacterized protein